MAKGHPPVVFQNPAVERLDRLLPVHSTGFSGLPERCSSSGVKTPLARFLRGVLHSTVDVPGKMLRQVLLIDTELDTARPARFSLGRLTSIVASGERRNHRLRQVIESSSCASPRFVFNSGGVSSPACVPRGLSVSASSSARAPAALVVMPTVALAGDAVGFTSLHDATWTRLQVLMHAEKRGGVPRSGQGLLC